MKYSLTLLILFFNSIRPEGFAAGTLVRIEEGHKAVESLKAGDDILSCGSDFIFQMHQIKFVSERQVEQLIKITCGDEAFFVAPDQKFYSSTDGWLEASNLTNEHFIACSYGQIGVDEVEVINKPLEVYALSPENKGYFYISKYNVLVYNYTSDPVKSVIIEGVTNVIESAAEVTITYGLERGSNLVMTRLGFEPFVLPPGMFIMYPGQDMRQAVLQQIVFNVFSACWRCYFGG